MASGNTHTQKDFLFKLTHNEICVVTGHTHIQIVVSGQIISQKRGFWS